MDGGMFYIMVRDLQASQFALPVLTTYNQANIPFAYPPLAFYIAGGLDSLINGSLETILIWQPLIANLLTLPLFFVLARQILHAEDKAALATLIFALTPNSYWWQIVGGGLTRSLGALFFLLTILSADRMYRTRKPAWVTSATIAGSLAALSHPEWALQTVTAVFLFWLFYGRDRQGFFFLLIVGAGIGVLTAPWWLSIVHQHEFSIFLQAGQATKSRWLFWSIPLTMGFTGEYTPVIAVLALCGLFLHIAKKEYLLPTWALVALFVDPRGGIPASVVPFSIMATTLLMNGIAPLLAPANADNTSNWTASLQSVAGRVFWAVFLTILLYGSFRVSLNLSQQSLEDETRDALQWVATNTHPSDRFLILDWQENPLLSPLQEWFPALTGRRSITTVQGSEWLTGEQGFQARMDSSRAVHACAFEEAKCLDFLAGQYEYVFLSIKISGTINRIYPLLLSLERSDDFLLVYSTPGIRIFNVIQ